MRRKGFFSEIPELELKMRTSRVFFVALSFTFLTLCAANVPHILVTGKGQQGEMSPAFDVLDHEGKAHESYEKAEQKFLAAAARFSISSDEDNLHIKLVCPVPEGVEYAKGNNPWEGDAIEVFIKPCENRTEYFQYMINADNVKGAIRYNDVQMKDPSWTSKAELSLAKEPRLFTVDMLIPKSELVGIDWKEGSSFKGNIIRHGNTAGGVSCWSRVSLNFFHDPARFGTFIIGSRCAYFKNELDKLLEANKPLPKELAEQAASLADLIQQKGEQPTSFGELGIQLKNFRQKLISSASVNMKTAFYDADVWGNRFEPNGPITPLKKITMRAPMNGRAVYSLAFSNLTGDKFMGQFKFLTPLSMKYLYEFGKMPFDDFFCRHITVSEAVPIQDLGGSLNYDVLIPLPLNTLIRCDAHATMPLFIEVDTRGLKPGVYKGLFYFKPSYIAFEQHETIDFELTVWDVDLNEVELDSFTYNNMVTGRKEHLAPERAKFLIDHEVNILNVIPGSQVTIMPEIDPQGNVLKIDFSSLDALIDHYVECGMPLRRIKMFIQTDARLMYPFVVRGQKKGMRGATLEGVFNPAWVKAYKVWLASLVKHLKEKHDMGYERFWIYPIDEPSGDPADPTTGAAHAIAMSKIIKSVDPNIQVFANPYDWKTNEQAKTTILGMGPHIDLMCPARSYVRNDEIVGYLHQIPSKVCTYIVLNNHTPPAVYRGLSWQNLRDGFEPLVPFWSIDSSSGFDGFDPRDTDRSGKNRYDYAATYIDWGYDKVLTSRRMVAWYQGFQDRKIAEVCRKYMKVLSGKGMDVSGYEKQIHDIAVKASKASMDEMEQCRLELMTLAVKLKEKAK